MSVVATAKRLLNELAFRLLGSIFPIAIAILKMSPRLQELVIAGIGDSPIFKRAQSHISSRAGRTFNEAVGPRAHLKYLDYLEAGTLSGISIVVPIHNAFEALQGCLASLVATCDSSVRILLIDDCSTDPRIVELLTEYSAYPNVKIVTNRENLGYTRTVNLGFKLSDRDDVILLNSDTITTGRWWRSLQYLAYSDNKVASVTAVSDNSGAFSVSSKPLSISSQSQAEETSRRILHATQGRILDVPTGNGFCMFIRRAALDQIGDYDEGKYPRGYGEENDFSMRAYRAGWTSLVSDKAFVFHLTSQSFGTEKYKLIKQGLRQLEIDYPEYNLLTHRFSDGEFQNVRERVAESLKLEMPAKLRVLYVMPIVGGGLPATNQDLRRSLADDVEAFILVCRGNEMSLHRSAEEDLGEPLEVYHLENPVDAVSHRSREYDRVVADMIYRHSIDVMHIEHMAWQSLGVAEAAKAMGVRTVFTAHDFYSTCASHNLLDENGKYCGGKCTAGEGVCQIDLWPTNSLPQMKHNFIERWKENFADFFSHCDVIVAPSQSCRGVLLENLPSLESKVLVIPHERNIGSLQHPNYREPGKMKLKVLVPGNIGMSKGAILISKIAKLDKSGEIEFHFLGETWFLLKSVGVHHGTYRREDFQKEVLKINADIAAIFSIWPETFCHTLTESWASGLPVFAIDLGAVGDRIRETGAGWLLPNTQEASEVLEFLLKLRGDTQNYKKAFEALADWQAQISNLDGDRAMRNSYLNLYNE